MYSTLNVLLWTKDFLNSIVILFPTALEEKVAMLLEKEAALYVPSGTMANLICGEWWWWLELLVIMQFLFDKFVTMGILRRLSGLHVLFAKFVTMEILRWLFLYGCGGSWSCW